MDKLSINTKALGLTFKKRVKPIFKAYSTIYCALILNKLLKSLRELPCLLKLKICLDVIAKFNVLFCYFA